MLSSCSKDTETTQDPELVKQGVFEMPRCSCSPQPYAQQLPECSFVEEVRYLRSEGLSDS